MLWHPRMPRAPPDCDEPRPTGYGNDLVTSKNHEVLQLNRDNARLAELQGQSQNALRTLRREHERVVTVAEELPGLK